MTDYWQVRARTSTPKQREHFGEAAWRPYLLIKTEGALIDDNFVRRIVMASFDNRIVRGVWYKKYFDMQHNLTFEYQYARAYYNPDNDSYYYDKFINVII